MESERVQMHQSSKSDQSNDKENVVLRALVGDPNRHKPLIQHPPPTTTTAQQAIPASMYTLETRYRPIPRKVLPKPNETRVDHIDSEKAEQNSAPSSTMIREDTIVPVEPEVQKIIEEQQQVPPTIFLEPKIISQPVLYSIVGTKTLPVPKDQPIPVDQEMPSSLLYTITGQPHRPTLGMNTNSLNVAPPVIDKPPLLYTLVGSPRSQVRIPEPVKEVLKIPKQPLPILYLITGNPRLQPQIEEPVKQISQVPTQPSSSLYSIVGNPSLASHITQTNGLNPLPSVQPVKASSVQPVPILHTIVGETQVPNNIPKGNRPPLAPIKQHANNITMYTVVGEPSIPQSITMPRKAQPLQPQKQQQQPPPHYVPLPSLYSLVGNPNLPPEENINVPLKPLVRRKTPPPSIIPTRRISRSLDRQTAPNSVPKPLTSMPPIKNKRRARSKEGTIPKSETIFFPLPENERAPRPKKSRTTPWYTSPEQPYRRPFQIAPHDPLRLPDYISPYAYHPARRYRDETLHPIPLPIITNKRSQRKPRPVLYDPYYRVEQKPPYVPWTHHSLERYSVVPKDRPRLWDYEDQSQTDVDDQDDTDELDSSRKKQRYRRIRPRTPWIPVW